MNISSQPRSTLYKDLAQYTPWSYCSLRNRVHLYLSTFFLWTLSSLLTCFHFSAGSFSLLWKCGLCPLLCNDNWPWRSDVHWSYSYTHAWSCLWCLWSSQAGKCAPFWLLLVQLEQIKFIDCRVTDCTIYKGRYYHMQGLHKWYNFTGWHDLLIFLFLPW